MAAEFIGSAVLVTLKSPPNGKVRGTVADIVGHQLTLQDVTWLASGHCHPIFTVEATNISDLEVVPEAAHDEVLQTLQPQLTPSSPTIPDGLPPSPLPGLSPARECPSPARSPHGGPQAIVDPAILSYGKLPRPRTNQISAGLQELEELEELQELQVPQPELSSNMMAAAISMNSLGPSVVKPSRLGAEVSSKERQHSLTTATLMEPFVDTPHDDRKKFRESGLVAAELATNEEASSYTPVLPIGLPNPPAEMPGRQTGRRTRRRTKSRGVKNASVQASISVPVQGIPSHLSPNMALSKKLNNTPMPYKSGKALVEAENEADPDFVASPSAQGNSSRKLQEEKFSRRAKARAKDAQSGWATEDATDIQEMEPFDFVGNLSKFDKRGVFDQLRKDDRTADESRLVHHNRLPPKPGTAGGKNLHWTQNVLEVPQSNGYGRWNSEAGESDDEVDDHQLSSGSSSSRNRSRGGPRVPQSRKGSAKAGENQPWVDSRLLAASLGSARYPSLERLGSPKPGRNTSASPFTGSIPQTRPSLRTIESNKHCPCLSPLRMLEFEHFAVSELGLSEDIMTENAARGIVDTFIVTSCETEGDRGLPDRLSSSSIIVVVGNHKTGARAVAAGRHLQNHGFRVMVTILGMERENDLLDSVKIQLNAYRKAGGSVLKPSELLEGLKEDTFRPTSMIDALLAIHTCFEDLRSDDQAFFFELALWLHGSAIDILSVDVPSGVDASNGEVTIVDNEPLALVPKYVVCLGAPKPWLLATLRDSYKRDTTHVYLVDIGISNLAWKRLGNRRNRGVDFGSAWTVKLRYQSGTD
ncbi:enhancer of mRNA decapping [Xylographa opegraphella]|nr:enhancer of mRNA decapping [Xylographa opegraphella]